MFLLSINVFAQTRSIFEFKIREVIFSESIEYLYEIKDNKLLVYSDVWKYNSKTEEYGSEIKKREKAKISNEDYEKIKLISRELLSFDTSYCIAKLGGYMWIIDYSIDGVSKKIKLVNYSLKGTNEIFRIINKYIRKKKYSLLISELNN
ncbi:MAG: hypothetical protein WCQ30_03720 [Bacteroidales bacterium]